MKFILIIGPHAVGKMTVGQELQKITNLKLFHNHMSIEPIVNFFDHGTTSFKRLSNLIREEIFKEVASSDLA
jgi:shikimate kinase